MEINDVIKEYLEKTTIDSAIMINGDWGSGKTYYVHNELQNYIEKDLGTRCIYISLYGVSQKSDISKEIFLRALPLKKRILPDMLKNYGTEIGKIFLDKYNIKLSSIDYSKFTNIKSSLLIFDDLERSSMNIIELLGYINKFVEHEHIHTILIANEKVINENGLKENQEMKYFLTTLDKFNFAPLSKDIDILAGEKDRKELNRNDIKTRIEYLFNSEMGYPKIKEKLVSKTIYYVPNISKVYEQILIGYEFNELELEILKASNKDIENRFENENHNNIRTLNFILNNFLSICKELRNFKCNVDDKRSLLKVTLDYLTLLSVRYKEGSKIDDWIEKNEYADINLSEEIFSLEYLVGFKFINDLVLNSFLDSEQLNFTLNQYLDEKKKNALADNDPMHYLGQWWLKEDEEVSNLIDQVYYKVIKNEYNTSLYPKILLAFMVLRKVGLDTKVEKVFSNMIINIKASDKEKHESIETFGITVDEDIREEYYNYIGKLKEEFSSRDIDIYKNKINNYFNPEKEWSHAFSEYLSKNKNEFLNRKKFFALINTSDLMACLDKSKNADIVNFSIALSHVYSFSNIKEYYHDDYTNINIVIDEINKLIEDKKEIYGKIKITIFESLEKKLKDFIIKLS